MDWININDKQPELHQEVIVASSEGRVKSAIYIGNMKWSTYVPVFYWMPYPEPPIVVEDATVEVPKKKRGRPKKV